MTRWKHSGEQKQEAVALIGLPGAWRSFAINAKRSPILRAGLTANQITSEACAARTAAAPSKRHRILFRCHALSDCVARLQVATLQGNHSNLAAAP